MDWVSGMAAGKTVEYGSKMLSKEECDAIEAPKLAEEARRYIIALSVIQEARAEEDLVHITVKQTPSTL